MSPPGKRIPSNPFRRTCSRWCATAASSRIWRSALRERLKERRILVAAGVYDAFTALIAEQAGLEALYLTGAGIAYTRLGSPDISLVTASEVADTLASIGDRAQMGRAHV